MLPNRHERPKALLFFLLASPFSLFLLITLQQERPRTYETCYHPKAELVALTAPVEAPSVGRRRHLSP